MTLSYHHGRLINCGEEAQKGCLWVQEGNTDAQYNAARILRHLAMGGSPLGKTAARQAIPALVQGLKVRTF